MTMCGNFIRQVIQGSVMNYNRDVLFVVPCWREGLGEVAARKTSDSV